MKNVVEMSYAFVKNEARRKVVMGCYANCQCHWMRPVQREIFVGSWIDNENPDHDSILTDNEFERLGVLDILPLKEIVARKVMDLAVDLALNVIQPCNPYECPLQDSIPRFVNGGRIEFNPKYKNHIHFHFRHFHLVNYYLRNVIELPRTLALEITPRIPPQSTRLLNGDMFLNRDLPE